MKQRRKRLDQEQFALACARALAGEFMSHIATDFGVDAGGLAIRMRKAGVPVAGCAVQNQKLARAMRKAPEERLETQRRWRRNNPERVAAYAATARGNRPPREILCREERLRRGRGRERDRRLKNPVLYYAKRATYLSTPQVRDRHLRNAAAYHRQRRADPVTVPAAYIAQLLGLPVDIARPLIPAKRALLQLQRELRKDDQ